MNDKLDKRRKGKLKLKNVVNSKEIQRRQFFRRKIFLEMRIKYAHAILNNYVQNEIKLQKLISLN